MNPSKELIEMHNKYAEVDHYQKARIRLIKKKIEKINKKNVRNK